MAKEKNYIYILKCNDDTLYTGWTNDLEKRVMNHNTKKGAKYTKNRLPAYLTYFETFDNKIDAMKREYFIKQLSRKEKEELISKFKGIRKMKLKDQINEMIKGLNN
ncbi:MAG: GIY-YIG nuclease family protein [Clostridia bacterium]|nr:GIY-YIG nuclease family protein [Clostridia bacterium]